MYNGNVQQNPLCVKSCVTKELSISPRFSPTFFLSRCKFSALTSTPDCTAVDSKPCVRNCSREREGLYNVYVHLRHKRMNALSTEPCFPIAGAVTCSRTSASRHTSFVSIMQALSFHSLGVPSPASSHTSRPKTFSFRGPCAGVQIPRPERQWS